MMPPRTARLLGPDGPLHSHVAAALREAGWEIGRSQGTPDRLDLGVSIPTAVPAAPLLTTSSSAWWRNVGENLDAAFYRAKDLIPPLVASGGALVFVTSLLGEIGAPYQTAFSASAAGIVGMVKALTIDVPAVRFSAVTPAWPVPEEPWYGADVDWRVASRSSYEGGIFRAVADAVLFLANDKEGHLRGQVIRIPSGITT